MYEHEFKPADGLISARQVVGNIAASEDKLREGEEIARQLVEDFGDGKDLAARVGYDDAEGMREAISRLEVVTDMKEKLEKSCEEVKEDLESNVESLRKLVLEPPGAATSAIQDERATIGAVVLQLLPLVVTDIPAALEKFPSLKDALSSDIVAARQTQISSGQMDNEQLEDLQKQVESLERKCAAEATRADAAVKGRQTAEARLESKKSSVKQLNKQLGSLRGELRDAEEAAEGARGKLEKLHGHADKLEQDLSSEQRRAARYKEELRSKQEELMSKLEVSETNAENHRTSVVALREQLSSERENKTQGTRLATLKRLQKDLDAERASHAASRDRHAEIMNDLENDHQVTIERMQGQADELRSENIRVHGEISSRDTELGKMQGVRERLEKKLEWHKAQLARAKTHFAKVRSDMQAADERIDRVTKEKEDALAEKDTELAGAHDKIAEMHHLLQTATNTVTRLRGERDELRASNEATAASSGSLKDAQRRIAELKEENRDLKIKHGLAEHHCDQAREKNISAEARLKAKEDQLQKVTSSLRGQSREAKRVQSELSERDMQLESAVQEIDGLQDEIEGLQRTIKARDDLLKNKSVMIESQTEMLTDQEATARGKERSLARELQDSRVRVSEAEAQLSDKQRELDSAQWAQKRLFEVQELNDQQNDRIDALEAELQELHASGSASAEETTENNRQASLFLANMAGLKSGGAEFDGLVSAIFNKGDVVCASEAPPMWTVLRSWDGITAGAAATQSQVPRGASLHMGVLLLLGEVHSGDLDTERSQAVLDGLIASVGSADTQVMPMAILTELAGKVVGVVREAAHVRVEFPLAFWQLMELVERRAGGSAAQETPWCRHKSSLAVKLSQHPCSLVFGIVRGRVSLEDHDSCRLFGDGVALCSRKDWERAVVFDTKSRTLRFVDKSLISTPSLYTLRIGPETGHDAVDLQLQSSAFSWQARNI